MSHSDSLDPSTSLELPPLHILQASGRPLLLEPDASNENIQRPREEGNEIVARGTPSSLGRIPSKDDFVQLPQPPRQHKAAQVVPPIIIGLLEPPAQATIFPPIAFHDRHGRNSLNMVLASKARLEPAKTSKEVRARKKWSEEETNHLLLGVAKHGVGKWTDIVDDPSFSFNGRSGVDLKDRFRTCCPAELRGDAPREDGTRQSRAHRRKMEDLAQLGIQGPFRSSPRRARRPFTEQDDRDIAEGYRKYGPAWTRIQRDPKLHLQSRQATDLRDRFRNKHDLRIQHAEPQLRLKPSFTDINSILSSNNDGLHQGISYYDMLNT